MGCGRKGPPARGLLQDRRAPSQSPVEAEPTQECAEVTPQWPCCSCVSTRARLLRSVRGSGRRFSSLPASQVLKPSGDLNPGLLTPALVLLSLHHIVRGITVARGELARRQEAGPTPNPAKEKALRKPEGEPCSRPAWFHRVLKAALQQGSRSSPQPTRPAGPPEILLSQPEPRARCKGARLGQQKHLFCGKRLAPLLESENPPASLPLPGNKNPFAYIHQPKSTGANLWAKLLCVKKLTAIISCHTAVV